MKRKFHIWVENKETNEVKCKVVEANNFAAAASEAYYLSHTLQETTGNDWNIVSLNDINFSYNPKAVIT